MRKVLAAGLVVSVAFNVALFKRLRNTANALLYLADVLSKNEVPMTEFDVIVINDLLGKT